jgi:hypothetical protein
MIPVGYMAKRIAQRPVWIKEPSVIDVYSVSNCISDDYCDYINYWKHNGYWLFNSPEVIECIAHENNIDLSGTNLFYYEVYERQFNADDKKWEGFDPEASFETNVVPPVQKPLEGYDVVTFTVGTSPECSPLSCNNLAEEIETNEHCLLDSFDRAKKLVETGRFNNSEPGPYRIFAVYSFNGSV